MKHITSSIVFAALNARRMALTCSLMPLAAASALLGCTANTAGEEEVSVEEATIIGGNAITVATRRQVGLVTVNNGACSGSLITPHWVLTATHCLNLTTPTANSVQMPRTDGGTDSRTVSALSRVAQTDMTVLQLQASTPGTWPTTPTRTMAPNADLLVGKNVSCYGQGATAYASPSGVTGAGQWRSLVKPVASFNGSELIINADASGNHIVAPGDSGGPCFSGSQIAAVNSRATGVECTDPTNNDTCKATITKIRGAALASTSVYANYINQAPSRTATATFRQLTLASGWEVGLNVNEPGVAVVDGTVHLRGAITTTGTDALAFSLPVGFRPSTNVYVPVNLCSGFKGRLFIEPNGSVSVHTESDGWANAQCLTSLDGASFMTSSVFTNLTLLNGWTNAPFTTRNAAATLTNGIVRLRGAIAGGTNAALFTLPTQFRPPTNVYANVDLCNAGKGRLNIRTSGEVTVQSESGFGAAQCFTSLEGVSYAMSSDAWISLTPLNGWTGSPFTTRNPSALNVGGVVRLQGAVATTGTDTHAFTLPAQLRPATLVYLPVDLCAGQKGGLTIQEDGRVFVQSPHPWSTVRCFASLEGLTFGL